MFEGAPFNIALRCALLILFTVSTPATHAAAVYLKDQDDPIVGFLIKQDPRQVVIEEVQRDGSRQRRTFARRDIELLVLTVSAERLGSLDHKKPVAYREYAEELAEQRRDPEAREMAIRLFLIAAHLDPEGHGRGSLLGLIDLAKDKHEESKFRAMAYLLDPHHDPRTLRPPEQIKAAPRILNASSRDLLVIALKLLRQGKRTEARRAIDRTGVKDQLEQFHEVITCEEFMQACSLERIPTALLRKIVLLELALHPQSIAGRDLPPKVDSPDSWRDAIRRAGRSPVPALSLETMTKFNPHKCHFRDNRWVDPGDF